MNNLDNKGVTIRNVQNKIKSASWKILLVAAVQEYKAPWLKEEKTVHRDESGRFASKGKGQESDTPLETALTDMDFFTGGLSFLTEGIPSALKKLESWENKNELSPSEKEAISKKGKRAIQQEIGVKKEIEDIGNTLEENGIFPPDIGKGFREGLSQFWKKANNIANSGWKNFSNFIKHALKTIQEGVKSLIGKENSKADSEKEGDILGQVTAALKGSAGVAGRVGGVSALTSFMGAMTMTYDPKKVILGTLAGTAAAEGSNFGIQSLISQTPIELNEEQEKVVGTISRIAGATAALGFGGKMAMKRKSPGEKAELAGKWKQIQEIEAPANVYVKSAGSGPQFGYRWKGAGNEQQNTPKSVQEIKDLVQSESRSVVLRQKNGELTLYVTGMETSVKDYQNRNVRNSVAWVGDKNNRPTFFKLAADALRNQLDDRVNWSRVDDQGDFRIVWEELSNIEKNLSKSMSETGKKVYKASPKQKLAKNTPESREELAKELETLDPDQNPDKDFLVVVTGNKSKERLKKSGAWRALSNLID